MQQSSPEQRAKTQEGWIRFYSLVAVVVIGLVITLLAFFVMPGLQNPDTGRLPEAASRALIFLPIILLVGSVLIIGLTARRR